jgi:hypothetical protein
MLENELNERIKDLVLWGKPEARAVFEKECAQAGINENVIKELLVWTRDNQHRSRRAGMTESFDEVFTNTQWWGDDNVAQ